MVLATAHEFTTLGRGSLLTGNGYPSLGKDTASARYSFSKSNPDTADRSNELPPQTFLSRLNGAGPNTGSAPPGTTPKASDWALQRSHAGRILESPARKCLAEESP